MAWRFGGIDINKKKFHLHGKDVDLIKIMKKYPYVLLYGAGTYGKRYYQFFLKKNCKISGFVVTKSTSSHYCGHRVWGVDDIPFPAEKTIIILTLHNKYHQYVRKMLLSKSFYNIYCPTAAFNRWLSVSNIEISKFEYEYIKHHYPLKKVNDVHMWRRLLIVRLDAVGDMVLTIPFIRELRMSYPDAVIDLVMCKTAYNLMEICPYLDNIYIYYPNDEIGNFLAAKLFASRYFVGKEYDAVFLPRVPDWVFGDLYVAVFSRAAIRIGFSRKCCGQYQGLPILGRYEDKLLSFAIPDSRDYHEAERDLSILSYLGKPIKDKSLELWLASEDEYFVDDIFAKNNICQEDFLVAFVVHGNNPVNNWNTNNYKNVLIHIIQSYPTVKVIFLGDGKSNVYVSEILQKHEWPVKRVINLCGMTTLRQAAAIFKRCKTYFGCDTGLMHIAAAMGTYVIELSSCSINENQKRVNSPKWYGPWQVLATIIQPKEAIKDDNGGTTVDQITVEQAIQNLDEYMLRIK